MRRARLAALLLCVALGAALLPVVPAGAAPPAAPACDPVQTPPELAGQVPTAEEVIGFPLGERDVTVAESDAYLQAVADGQPAGDRRHAAASWQGRPLRYAIVGRPGNVTPAGAGPHPPPTAPAARPPDPGQAGRAPGHDHARRSCGWPATSTAARRAAPTPRCGSCYELADRRDCAAGQILDNAIVVAAADPEPGRPRGRHPAQRLRLRHEPRLVRPHPARDRRQDRAAAPLPAGAVHRRPRDGPARPSSSRPTPTRSTTRSPTSRSTGSTTSTAAAHDRRVHPPGHPVLQPRRLRPVLHGLRRHRARRPASSPPA